MANVIAMKIVKKTITASLVTKRKITLIETITTIEAITAQNIAVNKQIAPRDLVLIADFKSENRFLKILRVVEFVS